MAKQYKPVVLVVMDGVGVNIKNPESTWKYTSNPTLKNLEKFFPFTTLQASGIAVGLPWGHEGNSEVGHLTIGAGKTLLHHLPRIISSVKDETFFKNPVFLDAAKFAKENSGAVHLIGLFASGSVHAYSDHLYALLDFCKKENLPKVYLHLFTDGRDSSQNEGADYFKKLEDKLNIDFSFAKIVSVVGRDFAMDRNKNWKKVESAVRCFLDGAGHKFEFASRYIQDSYTEGKTDEFIEPGFIFSGEGQIKAGDSVIFYNFREDSMRELVSLMTKKDDVFFATMTEYEKSFKAKVAFPPVDGVSSLSRIISENSMSQLKIAESEKYAHVTYFFNGGVEEPFLKEERILIDSPKKSFEDVPEMSAEKITDTVLENIKKYDFILVNFANGDMVGHTGNFNATIKALEYVDFCVGRIVSAVLGIDGVVIVTADHGNAEEKIYGQSGEQRTKHNLNPVPFFVVSNNLKLKIPRTEDEILKIYEKTRGLLTDVAPTVLELLGLPKHPTMTGINLLPKIIS
ncbi:MAG TPA: 2,3-bisphosphoglycerate-independent phosphoglycerate mutase [Candidatus Paceibacterota bacterium]